MYQNMYVKANPNIGMDWDIELGRMVTKAFGTCDELRGDIVGSWNIDDYPKIEGGNFSGGNGAFSLDFVDMEAKYEKIEVEMYKEAQTPLYEGCPISQFASILLLLNSVSTMELVMHLWTSFSHCWRLTYFHTPKNPKNNPYFFPPFF